MQVGPNKLHFFSHQPLSAFSKVAIATLLGITIFGVTMWATVNVTPFLYISVITLVLAGLIVTGMRWVPILGSVVAALFLFILLTQTTFPLYHLSHPKNAVSNPMLSFGLFIIIATIMWCMAMTIGAGVGATIQNYLSGERRAPRWLVPVLTGLIGVLLGAILISSFASPAAATTAATGATGGEPTVHMGINDFSQSSVTITKGAKLKIIDDGAFKHDLFNGAWTNGEPVYNKQAGAPAVNNVVLQSGGQSVEIGPFTSAGTYHIYCTIHPGMTLTIIVQ